MAENLTGKPVNSLSSDADVLQCLQANASQSHKNSVARMGVPPENAYGVSVAVIRKLAGQIWTNHALALSLWDTGNHEARLLAVLLADPEKIGNEQILLWLDDIVSWDLCDHVCKVLISKRAGACKLVGKLALGKKEFVRRAAFSTIANICMNRDDLDEEVIDDFLDIISQYADDDRNHVKKSVCWALREMGKRDWQCHERAVLLAAELKESPDKAERWTGRNALKELENLVSAPERKRLLTRKSKMGAKR